MCKLLVNIKKLTEGIRKEGTFESKEREKRGSLESRRIMLFRENIEYTLWLIRNKLVVINADLNNTTSLSDSIPLARTIRDVKKLIEKYNTNPLPSESGTSHILAILRTERSVYIKVAEAKELKARMMRGTVDPYVVISVDSVKKVRTPTIYKDFNPAWLQEYTLDVPSSNSEIQLSVYDEDYFTADSFLGHVKVKIDSIKDGKEKEQWHHLLPLDRKHDITGSVHLRFTYSPRENNKLTVTVIQAANLRSSDMNGLSDPYCKLYLGNRQTKQKTRVQKKTLHPIFNETFQYYLPTGLDVDFDLSIWDWDRFSKNDFLGGIRIPISEIIFDRNISCSFEHWFKLYPQSIEEIKKLGAIRLKLRYLEETIFPVHIYSHLTNFIMSDNFQIPIILGKAANATEEVISALIKLFYTQNREMEYLQTVIAAEINGASDANVLFRANSIATKSIDCYMKLIAFPYLHKTIGSLVRVVFAATKLSCEVTCYLPPNQTCHSKVFTRTLI